MVEHLHTTAIGMRAEQAALIYLQKQGLTLIDQNYRIKGGEIDLIMQDFEHVVFVEVKFRQRENYGDVLECVPTWKQSRLIRAATTFLLEKNWYQSVYGRFDVIGIAGDVDSKITWIKNAFEVDYA